MCVFVEQRDLALMALLFLHIQSVLSVSDIHLTVEDGEGVVLASHTILRGATLEDALTLEKGCSLKVRSCGRAAGGLVCYRSQFQGIMH